jgi:hypothetical protein
MIPSILKGDLDGWSFRNIFSNKLFGMYDTLLGVELHKTTIK